MSKFLSILLSMHILLAAFVPGRDMHELVKVPYLISHYQEHLALEEDAAGEDHPDFGFMDFLDLHYGAKAQEHKQENHSSEHSSLPFQNHNHQCSSVSIFIPVTNTADVTLPAENKLKLYEVYAQNFSSEYSFSIWQPPKFC